MLREEGIQRGRETETKTDTNVREKDRSVAWSTCPDQGSKMQPGCLGMEPGTFW